MATTTDYNLKFMRVTFPSKDVAHVELNRPEKMNAFTPEMFFNMESTFDKLSTDPNVRCIVLSGAGDRAFTSGLDVQAASTSGPLASHDDADDVARRAWKVRRYIDVLQSTVSSIERCEKPVIALCHGIAFGGAIDIASAADIRYCVKDTKFSIKEVDIGLAADIGSLSRLPKIGVSYSWVKEMTYTARIFDGDEAARVGFASKVFASKDEMLKGGLALAADIASKSPVAVQGSKALLDYSRDRLVEEGLRYTSIWNAAALQSDDVKKATLSGLQRKKPTFEKL